MDVLSQKSKSLFSVLFGTDENVKFYRPKLCYRQYPQCLITTNRDYIQNAKSLVFHWRDLRADDLPKYRNPDQLWTLYNLEAPPYTFTESVEIPSSMLFNLTATYRSDSDIIIAYGKVVPRSQPLSDEQAKTVLNIDLKSKTEQIAWFVSNCDTPSHREDYVKQLSRHIQVDIYGKCGSLWCPATNGKACHLMAAKEYKFYLSFENSICKYVIIILL